MSNLSTTIILLLVAIIILWLAVTDRLSRLLDAWDVITGKSSAATVASVTPTSSGTTVAFQLPALPPLAHVGDVPAVT